MTMSRRLEQDERIDDLLIDLQNGKTRLLCIKCHFIHTYRAAYDRSQLPLYLQSKEQLGYPALWKESALEHMNLVWMSLLWKNLSTFLLNPTLSTRELWET